MRGRSRARGPRPANRGSGLGPRRVEAGLPLFRARPPSRRRLRLRAWAEPLRIEPRDDFLRAGVADVPRDQGAVALTAFDAAKPRGPAGSTTQNWMYIVKPDGTPGGHEEFTTTAPFAPVGSAATIAG